MNPIPISSNSTVVSIFKKTAAFLLSIFVLYLATTNIAHAAYTLDKAVYEMGGSTDGSDVPLFRATPDISSSGRLVVTLEKLDGSYFSPQAGTVQLLHTGNSSLYGTVVRNA